MPTADSKRPCFRLSPDRFVTGLLLVIGLLWLSERHQWFGFDHLKGWTVLISVATVGAAALVMLLWWAAGLIFGWRFQFGIRSLLVFCLASSIVAGWLAVEIKRARRQAEVVEGIRNSAGLAFYDWLVDADDAISNPEPLEPRWLRRMLGDDFFSTVVLVNYSLTNITDARLEHLNELTQLRELGLNDTTITDAGLEHLRELKQLRLLDLSGTRITDAGLEHLKELTQLRGLDLKDTAITDAGLKHLEGLTQLRELNLHYAKVTDAGMNKLQKAFPNCKINH